MENFPASPAVYMLVHKVSGHFYIGSSSNLADRLRTHRYNLRIGKHKNDRLSDCYTEWGDFEVRYELCRDGDEALDREEDLISKFRNQDLCCNLGTGTRAVWEHGMPQSVKDKISSFHKGRDYGEDFRSMRSRLMTGVPRTDSEKRKISESLRGRTRPAEVCQKISEGRKGWQPTDDTRERMSLAKKGKPGQPNQLAAMKAAISKPVMVEGVRYSSITDAAKTLGIAVSTAKQRIESRTERFKNWYLL